MGLCRFLRRLFGCGKEKVEEEPPFIPPVEETPTVAESPPEPPVIPDEPETEPETEVPETETEVVLGEALLSGEAFDTLETVEIEKLWDEDIEEEAIEENESFDSLKEAEAEAEIEIEAEKEDVDEAEDEIEVEKEDEVVIGWSIAEMEYEIEVEVEKEDEVPLLGTLIEDKDRVIEEPEPMKQRSEWKPKVGYLVIREELSDEEKIDSSNRRAIRRAPRSSKYSDGGSHVVDMGYDKNEDDW